MKHLIYLLLLFSFSLIHAQSSSAWTEKPSINVTGFIDAYYAYDFNKPQTEQRQPFFFNYNRHNDFNINLGLIQFNLTHPKYRAVLAFQAGTYANDNYAAEPGVLKNINEAKVGISLNTKNNLWLDVGIMNSHLGFESTISLDDPTLTRSLTAESSPFFLTGAKLTFNPSDKWELMATVCNGWQRIERVQGNSLLSFGTQVVFTPSANTSINWSTFIGTDYPDSTRRMRYFNNFYGIFQLTKSVKVIAGFDIGFQQKAKNSSEYDSWLTPVIIAQYLFNEKWRTAIRVEYFQDESGVIIPTGTPYGFKTTSASLNFDYYPISDLACRIEGRWLGSKDEIFENNGTYGNNNFFVTASIAVRFNK